MFKKKNQAQKKKESILAGNIPTPDRHGVYYFLIALGVATLGSLMLAERRMVADMIAPEPFIADSPTVSEQAIQEEIQQLVVGYPIERMVPEIAKQDRMVAAYLVSIAKKESNWGKRVPVGTDGRDCYNYWGYRGVREEMGTDGHTCFKSSHEAVRTVAGRIRELMVEGDRYSPSKMIVWKCGYDCEGHSPESVAKWKRDVAYYFRKFIPDSKN